MVATQNLACWEDSPHVYPAGVDKPSSAPWLWVIRAGSMKNARPEAIAVRTMDRPRSVCPGNLPEANVELMTHAVRLTRCCPIVLLPQTGLSVALTISSPTGLETTH